MIASPSGCSVGLFFLIIQSCGGGGGALALLPENSSYYRVLYVCVKSQIYGEQTGHKSQPGPLGASQPSRAPNTGGVQRGVLLFKTGQADPHTGHNLVFVYVGGLKCCSLIT